MGFFKKKNKIEEVEVYSNDTFVYNKKTKEYSGIINEIEFTSDVLNAEMVVYAEMLAKEYYNNIPKIVDFMLSDERFDFENGFYPNLTKEKLTNALKLPMIRLIDKNNCDVSYLNHTLDDEHCIYFEVDCIFEKLYYLSIDG